MSSYRIYRSQVYVFTLGELVVMCSPITPITPVPISPHSPPLQPLSTPNPPPTHSPPKENSNAAEALDHRCFVRHIFTLGELVVMCFPISPVPISPHSHPITPNPPSTPLSPYSRAPRSQVFPASHLHYRRPCGSVFPPQENTCKASQSNGSDTR